MLQIKKSIHSREPLPRWTIRSLVISTGETQIGFINEQIQIRPYIKVLEITSIQSD